MSDDGRQRWESSCLRSFCAHGKPLNKQGPTSGLVVKTCSLQGTADHPGDLGYFPSQILHPPGSWAVTESHSGKSSEDTPLCSAEYELAAK